MNEGIAAEFSDEHALAAAIRALRQDGIRDLDAFMPFPAEEVFEALELRTSPVPRFVLLGALSGLGIAWFILWYTQVADYPLNVGGRPLHFVPGYVPLLFETAVLLGALACFGGLLWLCRLPRLHHPVMEAEGFRSATRDGFWVAVDGADPHFDRADLRTRCLALGATRVSCFPASDPNDGSDGSHAAERQDAEEVPG